MIRTSLAVLTNDEFIGYMFIKTNKTEAEIEATQRLELALQRIQELEGIDDENTERKTA